MCLAAPARVVALEVGFAVVDAEARRRRASTLLFPDVAIGEWVAIAAGSVVDRLSPAEAAEMQAILDRAIEPPMSPPER
jgi:hydrogenase assembly chaperone HypC/HupF